MQMLLLAFVLISLLQPSLPNELSPDLVNFVLSSGASVSASSTCGDPPAQFSPPHSNSTLLCNSSDPSLSYPASNLIDGSSSTRWQSGNTQSPVSITISLPDNQTFEVYILLVDFYSRPPSALAIEISRDGGHTFVPLQYYVSPSNGTLCGTEFGLETRSSPYPDDEINPRAFCSLYPPLTVTPGMGLSSLIWGSLREPRSSNLTEARLRFIRGTHVRLTMSGFSSELVESQQQYYSLGEVTLRGRCICNGHATACDSSFSPYRCSCQHNTTGSQCELCLPLYNQQPWVPSLSGDNSFSCEACNCMQHADSCEYDRMAEGQSLDARGNLSGGGVCLNCQNNTTGFNCEQCANLSYRDPSVPLTNEQTCKLCDCSLPGTRGGLADCVRNSEVAVSPSLAGDCFCKVGVGGAKCDRCQPHFYNTSETLSSLDCSQCECTLVGSALGSVCDDVTGQCVCRENVGERRCDQCLDGYHTISLQGCSSCSCDVGGSLSDTCNKSSGSCPCRSGIQGQQCTQPLPAHHLPSLHHIHTQAEYGAALDSQQLPISANGTLFPGFLGQGFVVVGSGSVQAFLIYVNVPRAATYRLVLRYSSQSMGFASFRFGRAGESLGTQGVFSLSSTSPSYTQAYVSGTSTPLQVDLVAGMYLLNATRNGGLLVDVLVLVPAQYYQPTLLGASAQNFTDNCDVTNNALPSEFCQASAFSLSASFVGGAVPCGCNSSWSLSASCQSLGGQCGCDPGVTGRKCDRCIFGFYANGNDGCIPCQCPDDAICDVTSGQCPCLTGVTNRQCDQCQDGFYSSSDDLFSDSPVCSPCECSLVGSASEVCDKSSGQCTCHVNVVGVKCAQCAPDHWNLTATGCLGCGCDSAGSEVSQCHLSSGQCSCKQLAEGRTCSECSPDTFLLSPLTPTGCTQCYCSGLSQNCSHLSGAYQDTPLDLSSGSWRVVSITSTGDISLESASVERSIDSVNVTVASSSSPLYLSYPLSQREMNLLLSYGDSLKFSLTSSVSHSSLKLILYHPSRVVEFYLSPLVSGGLTSYTAPLLEYNWTTVNTSPVTRYEFLDLLLSSPSLLIPIGEGNSFSTQLSGVSIPRASVQTPVSAPLPVERCQCPLENSGLSCQICSPGYFRGNGTCVPCECNGHSTECNPDNGTCDNCQDNTGGDRCQVCATTYFGDATQGTDQDCQPCPCSTFTASSLACSPDGEGEPVCPCKEGHIGNPCDKCDGSSNYYGDPVRFPNTSCSQCICSGNIDFSVPNSCNTTTGQCTLCINNSTGPNCDQCLSGFYGNASIQTCQTCQCNSVGSVTLFCEPNNGQCYCRPNVTGRQCDSCLPDHYNFNSLGCTPCLCDETGSNRSQCDLSSGQCACKLGVGGLRCDQCSPGYFNLTEAGCSPCLCGIGSVNASCDLSTGSCYCQPGVNGAKCGQCLPFYENLTSSGCSQCDACTEQLGSRVVTIKDSELSQVADNVTELQTLSMTEESSLAPHLTSASAVNSSLVQYGLELAQYHDEIIEINAGSINTSADNIYSYFLRISNRTVVDGLVTEEEYERVRVIALSVEMSLDLLQRIQTTTSSFAPRLLLGQVADATAVLLGARQLLASAQFNYSADVYQAMERLSDAQIAFHRSTLVSIQLTSQQSQISDLYNAAVFLNSSLLTLQTSLSNLRERNGDNDIIISEIRSTLFSVNITIMEFYGILSTIQSRINDISSQLNASLNNYRLANELYTSVAYTLDGTPQDGQMYNLETGDLFIQSNITELKRLHSDLAKLLAQAEMHQLELTTNTSLIESAYNSTQPEALDANAAITDYQEVTRLINDSCILANSSLQVAIEAVQQSAALIERGVIEQVAGELRIARTLLNISLQLQENVSYLTSEELSRLQANLTLLRQLSDLVNTEVVQANRRFNMIRTQVQFYLIQVSGILSELTAPKSCVISSSVLVNEALSRIQILAPQLSQRISNCSNRTQEFNELGKRAETVINDTVSALVERVQSISSSVNISDANMNKLNTLNSKFGVIESIRDKAFDAVARLKIALALKRTSSFTYRIPPTNVPLQYTQVSLYFQPTLSTGVLFFVQTRLQHFISLHLDEGVLVFSVDLDSANNVSIGGVLSQQWYQVLATRDGEQLTMSLARQGIEDSRTIKVEGNINSSEYLLFSPNDTLYVGHKPAQADNISGQSFEGCVEDISFNHRPIPLFDPIGNETPLSCGMRAVTRRYANGTWFYGGGYLILSQPHLPSSSLVISFRTFNDGILASTFDKEQRTIFILAITGGRIEFSVQEDQLVRTLNSSISVVNGAEHEVSIFIDRDIILFQVDQMPSGQLQLMSTNFTLVSLNIGGNPGSAASETFSGVVSELTVNGLVVNLSQAVNVSRALPFTPVDVTPGAYHTGTGHAQFALPLSTIPLYSLKFSFRSTALTGLLLLLFASDTGANPIHLALEHGRLTLTYMYMYVPPEGVVILRQGVVTLGDELNDGNFHSVIVEILPDTVVLSVDKYNVTSNQSSNYDSDYDIFVSTPLYVGGVPESARLRLPGVTSYKGCIRNLYVNDIMYNYTDVIFSSGVSLYGCEPAIEPPTSVSSPPPTPPTMPTSVSSPTPTPPSNVTRSLRFDSFNNSYVRLNVSASELATDTVFRIEFSSVTYNGNIFFVNGKSNFDFIELKFVAGKIQFSFSLGSFPVQIITAYRYDDGVRYRVEATRLGLIGLLTVLQIVGTNEYQPREYLHTQVKDTAFTIFDISNNFYLGGLPNQLVSADMCVTSFVINKLERLLTPGFQYRVNSCLPNISRGATFSGVGSYLQLLESFPVGRNLTVQFDFRSFNRSGLLFYIANPVTGDHVTLELRQGSLVYSVDNGEIPIVIAYAPASPNTLYNGLWHSVLLTKQDNSISITVDDTRLEKSISDSFVSVDTKSYPLFIGGIESGIKTLPHVTIESFRGCIREILLNGMFFSLSSPQVSNQRAIVAGCVI